MQVAVTSQLDPTDHLASVLDRAQAFLLERDEPSGADRAREFADRLRTDTIHVAVLGEFNRGKSTLIDALLGDEVLPRGVVPLTAVPTEIAWSAEPELLIEVGDDERVVDPAELEVWVTERCNPCNELAVRRARLGFPSELLHGGVVLYDTPGIASASEASTRSTLDLVPRIDAAIVVLSADAPLTDPERSFLPIVDRWAGRIFLVLNKIDAVTPVETSELVGFAERVAADVLGRPVEVYPISALASLARRTGGGGADDPGIQRLTLDLRDFLERDRHLTTFISIGRKTLDLLARERGSIRLDLAALELSARELRGRTAAVVGLRQEVDTFGRDLGARLDARASEVVRGLWSDLEAFRARERRSLTEAVSRELDPERGRRLRSEVWSIVEGMLRDDVSALRAQLEDDVTASFARAVAELIGQAEGEARRIREVGATLLDVAPTPPGPFEGRTEPSRFSLAHAEVPTVFESLVPERARWLPWAIARRRLEARVRGDADRLLDMYLGRIRSDEVRRIRAEVSRLAADLRVFVGASADALERAFDRARRAPLDGEGTTRDLRAALLDAEERLFRLDQETWEILCDAEWMGWTE